jgi:predicted phage terminase large subunit-like protein
VIAVLVMSLALTIASLSPAERAAFVETLEPREALALQHHWPFWARPSQIAPEGDWSTWLLMSGRGFGKTRVGAEHVHQWAEELGPEGRIALVGKDPGDLRLTMIDGESGLLATARPWFKPLHEPSNRRLIWPNGCQAFTYSAETPDTLRGPQHHKFWGDELCKWKRPQETWDNLQFGLRLGANPQGIITTTPRPIPTLREILADPSTVVTTGSTYDNAANLPAKFLGRLLRKYEGTRLGRQELRAELLTDTPGALWTRALLEVAAAGEAPPLRRIAIAIDPAGKKGQPEEPEEATNETGILCGGLGGDGLGYLLDDFSGHYSPGEWGRRAVSLYETRRADLIVAESNNGGEMVEHVVRVAARDMGISVNVKLVTASRGKYTRAEPVAALYEQHRIKHVGAFPELEDQLTTWVPGMDSPDRLDANVWLWTALMLEGADDWWIR